MSPDERSRVARALTQYCRRELGLTEAARAAGLSRREFLALAAASGVAVAANRGSAPRAPDGRADDGHRAGTRIRCLYNGYLLTANPRAALAADSTADRLSLFVLTAVLIDPTTGRIAATYPALNGVPSPTNPVAPRASEVAQLDLEHPPAPGVQLDALVAYWQARGVAPELLEDLTGVDLNGSVVTPGLIDDHFHVTSWSKKLPEVGERFGFWADVGDIRYYLDPDTLERVCTRQALWNIVAEANWDLVENERTGLYLHGFLHARIDDEPTTAMLTADGGPNPLYLPNRIGRGPTACVLPFSDPCTGDPASWPDLPSEPVPAVLVHTSGQACWYNVALLELFNREQETVRGTLFPPIELVEMTPVEDESTLWQLTAGSTADLSTIASQTLPLAVDAVVRLDGEQYHVPFQLMAVDSDALVMSAEPMIPALVELLVEQQFEAIELVGFWRPIPREITEQAWNEALTLAGSPPTGEAAGYGRWDPRRPYGTNWYNGAERGLVEFRHDADDGVWRPDGYAEHYVMRDALSMLVLDPPTVTEAMEHRRRLASWCHRHGLTAVNDIMFYRRVGNTEEFDSYRGLSYDHRFLAGDTFYGDTGVDPEVATGRFGLRVGIYTYMENAAEVTSILELSDPADAPSDPAQLAPPDGHPEAPGWVRWLGWKLQLDGGTGARTLFSNAPIPKPVASDPYTTVDEDGNELTFLDHSFGLLTMTNAQEQVFSSRECAALYWLVRESDPSSEHATGAFAGDWSFLVRGVVGWLDRELETAVLTADLLELDHVPLTPESAQELAGRIAALLSQVQSGYERTLAALAAIWVGASSPTADGHAIPQQTVCHCIGDGAVDLYVHAIRQLRDEVASLPEHWDDLPSHWREVVPRAADLSHIQRTFTNQRFRVEHLLNLAAGAVEDVVGDGGLDAGTEPSARNVVFSTQPSLLLLDGQAIRQSVFPYAQELWSVPAPTGFWLGVPSRPRSHHHMPCPVFSAHDIPFTLNTDPPSVRDPRPALTVVAAVARTPVEIDPTRWLDQDEPTPSVRPADYLVHRVEAPLGLTPESPTNPMCLTVEQALAAMTFWSAYVSQQEDEIGAIAAPAPGSELPGWHADLVVWAANPLAIRSNQGMTLDELGAVPAGTNDAARVDMVNAFISGFRPRMTIVDGLPVYVHGLV